MNGQVHEKNYRQLESIEEAFPGGWHKVSELTDTNGRVFAITLPEGNHNLSSWNIFNGSGMYIQPRIEPEPLEFTINHGDIVYLVNLHMSFRTGKNIFGITIVADGHPEIKNKSKRDILIFEERYGFNKTS